MCLKFKKDNFIPLFFLLLSISIVACGKDKPHQETIASVNDAPITVAEFQRELSLLSKRDPAFKITRQTLEEQLNTIIDKKLLLQEAMRRGLSEDPHFVDTIRTFWEQTLIKELVEFKTMEWADRLFVTEDEIQHHYHLMQYAPLVRAAKAKDKAEAEVIKGKMAKGLPVDGAETLGPLYLEDVRSDVLANAFDMNAGETRVYEAGGGYIVMQVMKKQKTALPPLKDIYSQIKTFLLEKKKQDAMEKWLKDVKGSAKIEINVQLLKGIAGKQ